MQLPPASVMVQWPKSNYIDPVTRGDALLIVNIIFTALSFVVVCLRIFARFKMIDSLGLDDASIIISMVRL